MTIDPIVDYPLDTYLVNTPAQWKNRIGEMSPCIAQCFDDTPMRCMFRMRYQGNILRVSLTPEEVASAGIDKPLAEVPIEKDSRISTDAQVLTYPPMSDEISVGSAQLLFGGATQGNR
jgi:hypothetical protein